MQKKHLIAYPLTAIIAMSMGAASAGGSSASTTGAAAPTPATTVTHTVTAEAGPPVTITATAPLAETSAAAPAPAPAPAAGTTIPGDGTYEVGKDIQPGTYVSDKPSSGNCYWARLKDTDSFEGIIANNNSAGRSVVAIKKSDKYFQSTGCSDWVRR
ncbi:hypothetical protein [uncultured Arsenicicoccus sp.]|uniref:hypothetical protein n=1 Tax=uncultured Arsenicicoccus sp. TaxID=491339 RepID=UPI0025957B01|nr:hypothetical protein [uncultured Arsenicicoccus sp.]